MRPEDTAKHWHDAYDRLLWNTLSTHSAAQAEPQPVTTESILRTMREAIGRFERPKYDRLCVGSFRPLHRRIREIYGCISIHGLPVTLDRNLPPYLGVLVGPPRGPFGIPVVAFLDMRAHPQTDDMSTMLDDLRRAGAVPAP